MTLFRIRLAIMLLSLAAAPLLLPMHAAHAQMSLGGGGGGGRGGAGGGGGDDDAADAEAKAAAAANAPPPALPGAVSNDAAAPTGHASLDMNPTAALFDSINRGDFTAAKEALSRGADLQGTNVLGEKPIESSIDLNRNDITFLLLSMRNTESPAGGGAQIASNTTSTGRDKSGHLAIDARTARRRGTVEEASYTGSRRSDDGGAAKPEIGFLGFGGS